ncbi:MAG: hypothetical protein JWO70_4806, partial [Betaproteobacteria bacterium]|nr:hypothetical protein [Betaproteobacteria bacterium]
QVGRQGGQIDPQLEGIHRRTFVVDGKQRP